MANNYFDNLTDREKVLLWHAACTSRSLLHSVLLSEGLVSKSKMDEMLNHYAFTAENNMLNMVLYLNNNVYDELINISRLIKDGLEVYQHSIDRLQELMADNIVNNAEERN